MLLEFISIESASYQALCTWQIVPDCVNWFQSDISNNVTISDNAFIGNNYAMAFAPGDVFITPMVLIIPRLIMMCLTTLTGVGMAKQRAQRRSLCNMDYSQQQF